jgi:hypothetical protein
MTPHATQTHEPTMPIRDSAHRPSARPSWARLPHEEVTA